MITVFISGWFNVLHPGYVDLLERARDFGERLVVGVYGDLSARALEEPSCSRVPQAKRAATLHALRCVDEVIIFDEPTPVHVIEALKPDVLIKSIDTSDEQVSGADIIWDRGGQVLSLPLQPETSTPATVRQIHSQEENWRHPEELRPDKSNAETPLMWVLRKHGNSMEERPDDHLATMARA
jgi:rfaE bifunctional protein nucleotidyltransferase chain/domain